MANRGSAEVYEWKVQNYMDNELAKENTGREIGYTMRGGVPKPTGVCRSPLHWYRTNSLQPTALIT